LIAARTVWTSEHASCLTSVFWPSEFRKIFPQSPGNGIWETLGSKIFHGRMPAPSRLQCSPLPVLSCPRIPPASRLLVLALCLRQSYLAHVSLAGRTFLVWNILVKIVAQNLWRAKHKLSSMDAQQVTRCMHLIGWQLALTARGTCRAHAVDHFLPDHLKKSGYMKT
jgi:hypothetical protein